MTSLVDEVQSGGDNLDSITTILREEGNDDAAASKIDSLESIVPNEIMTKTETSSNFGLRPDNQSIRLRNLSNPKYRYQEFFERQFLNRDKRFHQYEHEFRTGLNTTAGALGLRHGDIWNKNNITDTIRLFVRQRHRYERLNNESHISRGFIGEAGDLPIHDSHSEVDPRSDHDHSITKLSTRHNLKYMHLDSTTLDMLFEALAGDYIINHICLSNSRLASLSRMLCSSLSTMRCLTSLDLSQNCLTDDSILSNFIPVLPQMVRLELLSFSGNRLTIHSALPLVESVMIMASFRWLRLVDLSYAIMKLNDS